MGGRWRVCGGGDLLEILVDGSPPAEAVWQGINLIPLQSKAPFL